MGNGACQHVDEIYVRPLKEHCSVWSPTLIEPVVGAHCTVVEQATEMQVDPGL